MSQPRFDAVVAINQAVSAAYTLAAAFIGGYFAFRLGLRQLRNARALDRRLDWSEKLHDAITEYAAMLGALVREYEKPYTQKDHDLRVAGLAAIFDQGTEVLTLFERSQLYGVDSERPGADAFFVGLTGAHFAIMGLSPTEAAPTELLELLKATQAGLERHRGELAARVRRELHLRPTA
jgi:hypothetical protein